MSVGLRNIPEDIRIKIAHKREQSQSGGLGYWGARDAIMKATAQKAEPKK